MNKNAIIGIVVLIALVGGFLILTNSNYFGAGTGGEPYGNGTPTGDESGSGDKMGAKGTVYFSITDAAADMGAVSSIKMTVDKVEMHSNAEGWVTVSESPKTFDLLELKSLGRTELLAKADVVADSYDQIRLHMAEITVTESGQTRVAKLPSNELKINGEVKVEGGAESSAKIDVLASESLHKTGKGEFIFAPVLKFESRSRTSVEVSSGNSVTISGGDTDHDTSFGTDINGEVKENFKLDIKANLELDGGIIKLDGKSKAKIDLGL